MPPAIRYRGATRGSSRLPRANALADTVTESGRKASPARTGDHPSTTWKW